ncbi:MAG: RNA 2',3'-cyclic phosphodiesterase, partial [Nitrospirae bacterium]|nr:RNA 2',3'-cyclic phosphodiesterase [Nitrospirota bacterium]
VRPENLHITLKFLGNISAETIPQIEKALEDIVLKTQPFEIMLNGIGCFPNSRHPRVIWIGVKDNGILNKISKELNDRLSKIGKTDHDFSQHLTIGRVKDNHKIPSLHAEIERFTNFTFGSNLINTISLMKSELTPQGSIYSIIKDFNLTQKQPL